MPVVKINVGGRIFQSTIETLTKCSYFASMFSDRWYAESKEPDMEIIPFIDRDPEGFECILRHLRDTSYVIPKEWSPEVEFFGVVVEEPSVPQMKVITEDVWNSCAAHNVFYIMGMGMEYVDVTMELRSSNRIFTIPRSPDMLLAIHYNFYDPKSKVRSATLTRCLLHPIQISNSLLHACYPLPVQLSGYGPNTIIVDGELDRLVVTVRLLGSKALRKQSRKNKVGWMPMDDPSISQSITRPEEIITLPTTEFAKQMYVDDEINWSEVRRIQSKQYIMPETDM